jgi:hypothetical protein
LSLSTLGDSDRRVVHSWFDHLRNWRHDDFIRERSRTLGGSDSDLRVVQTSNDLMIVFRIDGDAIVVLSIFRKESLNQFAGAGGPRA